MAVAANRVKHSSRAVNQERRAAEPRRMSVAATPRLRTGISDWSDRQAGMAAVWTVGALALAILLIVAGVVFYATTYEGYAVLL